jgi:hypothetical protein
MVTLIHRPAKQTSTDAQRRMGLSQVATLES